MLSHPIPSGAKKGPFLTGGQILNGKAAVLGSEESMKYLLAIAVADFPSWWGYGVSCAGPPTSLPGLEYPLARTMTTPTAAKFQRSPTVQEATTFSPGPDADSLGVKISRTSRNGAKAVLDGNSAESRPRAPVNRGKPPW